MKGLPLGILLLVLAAMSCLPSPVLQRVLEPVNDVIQAALPICRLAKNSVPVLGDRTMLPKRASASTSTSHGISAISETPTATRYTVTSSDGKACPGTEYTVVPGDTLSAIAKAHGVTIDEIVEANEITDPDLLRIGQVLTIPS